MESESVSLFLSLSLSICRNAIYLNPERSLTLPLFVPVLDIFPLVTLGMSLRLSSSDIFFLVLDNLSFNSPSSLSSILGSVCHLSLEKERIREKHAVSNEFRQFAP